MQTLLLENNGLLMRDAKAWAEHIDPNFVEVNSDVRQYMRSDDLHTFASFINPNLTRILTSSEFPTKMPFGACLMNGKTGREGSHGRSYDEQPWTQLEYMTWLIYHAVAYRKRKGLTPLEIHVNYLGVNFLKDVNAEDLGPDVKTYLMLMFRQSEGYVKLFIYKDYITPKIIRTEDDLKLTR